MSQPQYHLSPMRRTMGPNDWRKLTGLLDGN